jgi:transposase
MNQESGADHHPGDRAFTEKQRQYLAFIYPYAHMFRRPPAEVDMQHHFQVTPPSVQHMVVALERNGFIRRYRVELSQAERSELTAMFGKGKRAARKLKRAQILLAADAGCSDEKIARTAALSGSTVYRTKRRFVEGNLERGLSEKPRPGAERKLTGEEDALLAATACAKPPEGHTRWTLELLAWAMVKLTERRTAVDYAH